MCCDCRKIDLNGLMMDGGIIDNYAILQDALAGGDCTVLLPPGRFLVSRTLKVFSNTKIIAGNNTVIRLAANTGKRFDDWLLTNADHDKGNSNIEISGGIWDVNGKENPRGEREKLDDYGGVGIYFLRMSQLVLQNITVSNPDSFFIMICETAVFRIENVQLFNDNPKINQDGVHVGGFCRDGLIRGLRAISPMTPGDDLVALNANDGVAHFTHGQKPGPIENIVIEDLYADSAYAFVRLLSQDQPIRNIRIKNAQGGVRNNFLNVNRWRFEPGGGNISDIKVSDVAVHKMPWSVPEPKINEAPLCDINLKVHNFVIENFQRNMLDNSVGDTFQVDMGVPCEVEYVPEQCGKDIEIEKGVDNKIKTCRLRDGGFKYLAINL
ncbi:MAG: hypothetical protein WAX69_15100 [Victivallales bacterium]